MKKKKKMMMPSGIIPQDWRTREYCELLMLLCLYTHTHMYICMHGPYVVKTSELEKK